MHSHLALSSEVDSKPVAKSNPQKPVVQPITSKKPTLVQLPQTKPTIKSVPVSVPISIAPYADHTHSQSPVPDVPALGPLKNPKPAVPMVRFI